MFERKEKEEEEDDGLLQISPCFVLIHTQEFSSN
jgi:hypothetical protein